MWKDAVMRLTKRFTIFLLTGFLVGLQWMPAVVTACHGMLAVIQIDYSNPEDITRAASVLLTSAGKLAFDRRTHSLIVNDTPQVVTQVRELIERLDLPAPGLKIRVKLGEVREERADELTARGRISGPGWSLGTKGREEDGIDVTLDQAQSRSRQHSEYMVKGQSGRPAYIVTGRDIPFTTRWNKVCGTFGGCRNLATYARVETGFEVLPIIRGQLALVSLTPRISSYEAGIVRFAGAVTQIRVPLGRWVDVGSATGGQNEAVSAVIDSGKKNRAETFSVWMMITRDP
jgi:hypothetical protein